MFLQKDNLLNLLNPFNGLIGKTAAPMILTNIQLISDGKQIIARGVSSGHTIMVQNSVPVSTDQFNILVSYEILSKLIGTHNKTIELVLNQKSLLLRSGKKESEVSLIEEEFVKFPTVDETIKFIYLDNKNLSKVLKQIRMSTGDKPFDVVYFNNKEIVATNRFQVSIGQFPVNTQFIISSEAVNYLLKVGAKLDSFQLGLNDKLVIFIHDNLVICTNRVDFEFPDYDFIKNGKQILMLSADANELKEGVERIRLFNPEKAVLEAVEEGLKLTTRGQKGIEESIISADLDGKSVKMKFNPQILSNYINSRKSGKIFLEFYQAQNFKMIALSGTDGTHYIPELLI